MTNDEVILDSLGAVAMVLDGPAIYSIGAAAGKKSNEPLPSVSKIDKSEVAHSGKIAFWGDDNLFPQNVIKDVEFNTIIGPVLDSKQRTLYSEGVATYLMNGYDSDNKPKLERIDYDPFLEFCENNDMSAYLLESIGDLYWFYNVFPEIVLSKDRKKITHLTCQAAEECRWELQDEYGNIKNCYINADWSTFSNETKENTIVVPTFDPYYNPIQTIRERTDSWKYIFPLSYPTPGKKYYQLAHWNAIRKSKWLDLARAIPEFKKALMENQLSIKYHIKIPDYWWGWKYPDWSKYNAEQRRPLIDKELAAFNTALKGTKGAGSTFMTTFKFNEAQNKEYPGWIITPLEDKLKDGVLLEDSQEASTHILFSLGYDGTLIGNTPGKGMGAGSGSDKKAAFNIHLALCQAHEDITLKPLRFLHKYNGWDKKVVYKFPRTFLQDDNAKTPSQRQPGANGTS